MSDNNKTSGSLFLLAAVGAVAVGAIAAAVAYKYLVPDTLDEFENDFDDTFDEEDIFEEEKEDSEEEKAPADEAEEEESVKMPLEKGFAEDHMFEEE